MRRKRSDRKGYDPRTTKGLYDPCEGGDPET